MLASWQPEIMEIDSVLLQQVEELSCGETVHLHANLSGAYRFSIDEFQRTGDEAYRLIAGSTFGTARLARQTAPKTRADQVGIGYFSVIFSDRVPGSLRSRIGFT